MRLENTNEGIDGLKGKFGRIITPYASLSDFNEDLVELLCWILICSAYLPIGAFIGFPCLIATILCTPLLIICGFKEDVKKCFIFFTDMFCSGCLTIVYLPIQLITCVIRPLSNLFNLVKSFFLDNPGAEPGDDVIALQVNNARADPHHRQEMAVFAPGAEPYHRQGGAFFACGEEQPGLKEKSKILRALEDHNITLNELDDYYEEHCQKLEEKENLTCPITYTIFTDPVYHEENGHRYNFDREAIINCWRNKHSFFNPLTRNVFKDGSLKYNDEIEGKILSLIRECAAQKPGNSIDPDEEHKSDNPRASTVSI